MGSIMIEKPVWNELYSYKFNFYPNALILKVNAEFPVVQDLFKQWNKEGGDGNFEDYLQSKGYFAISSLDETTRENIC